MDRHHRWSTVLATVVAAAMLIVATAAPALAADTRNVFVGSPGAADGALTFTPVSQGNQTKTDVLISNASQAVMNKTTLSIGTFPADALPAGVSIEGIYGPNGGSCDVGGDGTSASCSFGNLRSGQSKSIVVILTMGNAGTVDLGAKFLAVKVKETVNDNGANKDTFLASGTVAVAGADCASAATFVPPGKAGSISTASSSCTPQSTTIAIAAKSAGSLASLKEVADTTCLNSLTCFGDASEADINGGAPIALRWTISWQASSLPNSFNVKKAGVIHYDGSSIDVISFAKNACGNNANKTDCIESVTLDGGLLTIVFRTPSNGKVRGFG